MFINISNAMWRICMIHLVDSCIAASYYNKFRQIQLDFNFSSEELFWFKLKR